ncbi:MAG TPA: hypothetical protein VLB27_08475, partial [candidate division Zixibacteria bacterium]|nr:hypothetical protein [candidate division Zixibacteria bacterium]
MTEEGVREKPDSLKEFFFLLEAVPLPDSSMLQLRVDSASTYRYGTSGPEYDPIWRCGFDGKAGRRVRAHPPVERVSDTSWHYRDLCIARFWPRPDSVIC